MPKEKRSYNFSEDAQDLIKRVLDQIYFYNAWNQSFKSALSNELLDTGLSFKNLNGEQMIKEFRKLVRDETCFQKLKDLYMDEK